MSARRHAPATERNRESIAAVLAAELPTNGLVLEIASGSGEHCAAFAARFGALQWQPSDPEAAARASIDDWCAGLPNVLPSLALDAAAESWPIMTADAILCVNMVHISPWEATLGLMAGAGRLLAPGAPLVLYGPYRQRDVPTAESNEAFDVSLKARDPRWGLRHVEDVSAAAVERGLALQRIVPMPANNLSLVFRQLRTLAM
jgi:SAM-dependent methyltransferase